MRRKERGFTLIEIAIAVVILLLILTLAVPSINGVLADRRLRVSFDALNNLVLLAQERSVSERRAYLISWDKNQLILHPESPTEEEEGVATAVLRLQPGDAYQLRLPAALMDDPPAAWIFWPSGTCEPVQVQYKGTYGAWIADYATLTARGELAYYAPR